MDDVSTEPGYGTEASVIGIETADPHVVGVPDANLLFRGDFRRAGPDLVLTGPDGQHHIVPGYFSSEQPPALVAPNGGRLTGDVVSLLAGSVAPNQYAQAQPATPPDVIGRVEKVVGDGTVVRNGVTVALHINEPVYKSDVVQTGADSSVGLSFPDGTILNLVANTRMALNEYTYDPNSTSNVALISLVEGTFSFVAGRVAHSGSMKINTPVATMGIRGTTGMAHSLTPAELADVKAVATIAADLGAVTFGFTVSDDYQVNAHGIYDLIDFNGNVKGSVGQPGFMSFLDREGHLVSLPMTSAELDYQNSIIQETFRILERFNGNPRSLEHHGSSDNPNSLETHAFNETFQFTLNNNTETIFVNTQVRSFDGTLVVTGMLKSFDPPQPPSVPNTPHQNSGPSTPPLPSNVFIWNSGAGSGVWDSELAFWNQGVPPTMPIDTVEVQSGVLIFNNTYTIENLFLDAGATLDVEGGSLTVTETFDDSGFIEIDGNPAVLEFDGPATVERGAEILVNGTGAELLFSSGDVDNLGTIAAGHSGTVLFNNASVTNETGARITAGRAGQVFFENAAVTNDAVIGARHRGTITFGEGTTLTNDVGAVLRASHHGTVFVDDSMVSNFGTMRAGHGGSIQFGDDAAFVNQTGGKAEAVRSGDISFTGSMVTNDTGATIDAKGSGSTVEIFDSAVENLGKIKALQSGTVTITGSEVTNTDGLIAAAGDGAAVDLIGATITGGTLATRDGGIIEALDEISTLVGVTISGGSFLKADHHAAFDLQGTTTLDGTVTFEGCGAFVLDGGAIVGAPGVLVNESTIVGAGTIGDGSSDLKLKNEGTIKATGTIVLDTGNTVQNLGLIDISRHGELDVEDGKIDNKGSDATACSDPTGIVIAGEFLVDTDTLKLTGGGEVYLKGGTIDGNGGDGADTLVNIDNTIRGFGTIGDGSGDLKLKNEGTIDATGTIVLDTGNTVQNLGLIKVSRNGELDVQDSKIDNKGSGDPAGIVVAGTFLVDTDTLKLTGGGEVYLKGGTIDGNGSGDGCGGADTLINVDNTIRGYGTIGDGSGDLKLKNDVGGTIDATGTIVLDTGNTVTNLGLIDISRHGVLDVQDSKIDNKGSDATACSDPTGIVVAGELLVDTDTLKLTGGGEVYLKGGTIDGNGGGDGCGSADTLINVDNTIRGFGTIGDGSGGLKLKNDVGGTIDATGTIVLDTGNTVTNLGLIDISRHGELDVEDSKIDNKGSDATACSDPTGIVIAGELLVDTDTLKLTGGGEIYLKGGTIDGNGGGDGCGSADTLVNVDDTIRGYGTIGDGSGDLKLKNDAGGTIDATGTLVLDTGNTVQNLGLIKVSRNGELDVEDSKIDNKGSGDPAGIVVAGTFLVDTDTLKLTGDGDVYLRDGSIEGNGSGDGCESADTLINVDNTIRGFGAIGDGSGDLKLKNDAGGTIDATGTIVLDTGNTVQNLGLIKVSRNGELDVQDSKIDNKGSGDPAGIVVAGTFLVDTDTLKLTGGGDVYLRGGSIEGNGSGDGCESADTLINVDNTILGSGTIGDGSGDLKLKNEGTIKATGTIVLDTGNTVQNLGLIDVSRNGVLDVEDSKIDNKGSDASAWCDPSGIVVAGIFLVDADTLKLTGGGELYLKDGAIYGAGDGSGGVNTLVNVDNTILGRGIIGDSSGDLKLKNEGTIDATGTIIFETGNTVTNLGLIEVSRHGILDVQDSKIDNLGSNALAWCDPSGIVVAGTLLVDADTLRLTGGGEVYLKGGAIEGADTGSDGANRLINVDNAILGSGTIGDGSGDLRLTNEGTIDALGCISIDTGHRVINTQGGVLEAINDGTLKIYDKLINDGTLVADGGSIDAYSDVVGTGTVLLTVGGFADFAGAFEQNVLFVGDATLQLDRGACGNVEYTGTVCGFNVGDVIDLTYAAYQPGETLIWTENHADTGGTLTIWEPDGKAVTFTLEGDYTQADFGLSPDSGTGTAIVWTSEADWTNGDGGNWNDGCNWDIGGHGAVPTAGDGVVFDFGDGAAYTVNLCGGMSASSLTIDDHRATLSGTGTLTAPLIDNNGVIEASGGTLTIDSELTITNTGTLEASKNADLVVNGYVDNSHGLIKVDAGTAIADFTGQVVGGDAKIVGGTLEFDAASSVDVTFDNGGAVHYGVLALGDPSDFTGDIFGFTGTGASLAKSDAIDLAGFNAATTTITPDIGAGSSTLTVTDTSDHLSVTLTFEGNYSAEDFTFKTDHDGGVYILDPPPADTSPDAASAPVPTADGALSLEGGAANDNYGETVTPQGANYAGSFSLDPVSAGSGGASVGWEFDLGGDQINLAPGQTVTQSYSVNVADVQNPAVNLSDTVSVSLGGSGNDNFVFHPGVGADTIVDFNPQSDTIELDNFSNIQSAQQLASAITADSHGDAVIDLGHNDSITLPGMTAAQLQQVLASVVHLH